MINLRLFLSYVYICNDFCSYVFYILSLGHSFPRRIINEFCVVIFSLGPSSPDVVSLLLCYKRFMCCICFFVWDSFPPTYHNILYYAWTGPFVPSALIVSPVAGVKWSPSHKHCIYSRYHYYYRVFYCPSGQQLYPTPFSYLYMLSLVFNSFWVLCIFVLPHLVLLAPPFLERV